MIHCKCSSNILQGHHCIPVERERTRMNARAPLARCKATRRKHKTATLGRKERESRYRGKGDALVRPTTVWCKQRVFCTQRAVCNIDAISRYMCVNSHYILSLLPPLGAISHFRDFRKPFIGPSWRTINFIITAPEVNDTLPKYR